MRQISTNILILLAVGVLPSICFSASPESKTNKNLETPLVERKIEKSGLIAESAGQGAKAFFEAGSADSVFDDKGAPLTVQPALQMLNAELPKEALLQPIKLTSKKKTEEKKEEKEDLIKKWGDPNESEPITGEKTAPRPFRGMLAALSEGNEELAYLYARKYIRYVKDVEDRTRQAQELFKYARQREGIDPINQNDETPDYNGYRKHFEEDLRQTANQTRELKLDDKTRNLLERARKEELGIFEKEQPKSAGPALGIDDRGYVRTKLAKKIPIDPKREVEIYFFFQYSDPLGVQMVKALNEVTKKYSGDRTIRITGLALKPLMDAELAMYANTVQAGFAIRNGNEIAKQLKIIKSPTLAFTAPNSGEVMIEEGSRSFEFIDEVIKVAKGVQ